jgi:gluconate 2-dehydrogenase alpha chain
MSASDRADIVIVGLGAAGAVAAHVLTQKGLSVVGLEAGPRVDATMMTFDEIRTEVVPWMSDAKAAHEVPTWRTDASAKAGPAPYPMLMVNAVGGSAVHYEGASLRFHPWHFRHRSATLERYGAAAVPPTSTMSDWPIGYDDLEPYYERVEYAIGVSGQAGVLDGNGVSGGNPFEGSRRRGYPMPPLRPSGWMDLMDTAAARLEWHPFPVPAAINSRPHGGRPDCTYCGYCRGNGCYRNAKGSPDVTLIPAAEATGLLTVESDSRVTAIEVDRDGELATGVRYVKDGVEHFQPAAAVLLGGYVYENVRLLLVSACPAAPQGVANGHGQVGKHYMAHVTPFAFGVFPGRTLNRWTGSGGQIVCVDDWNADTFDHSELGFIGGGVLMSMGEVRPIQAAKDLLPPGIPRWGSSWKAWMRENAQSIGSAFAQFEPLPYADNCLDLDPTVRDRSGMPVVRVTCRPRANEERGSIFMRQRLEQWLAEAGAAATWSSDQLFLDGRHAYGGTRMGDDPSTCVVDAEGFAHEVRNLGLLGASIFPSAGGHNPTLTVQAMAWRTAELLADRWVARSGAA